MIMTKDEAQYKLAALCSVSEYCLSDIRKKLVKWEIESQDSEAIIAYLLKEKFVDESRYVRAFALDKMRFSKWGKNKVAFSLRGKMIPDTVCKPILDEIFNDSEDYAEGMQQVLQAKFRTLKYKNRYDAKTKLLRFGAGRGFEMSLMLPVIDKIVAGVDGSDDEPDGEW